MDFRGGRAVALALLVAVAPGPPALACPFCDGGPSGENRVRAAIFGDDFWFHFLAAALPFALVLAGTALLHFGLPRPRRTFPQGARDAGAN